MRPPRTVVTDVAGERHRVARFGTHQGDDDRIVETNCGMRIALIGDGHPRPKPCTKPADFPGTVACSP